MTVNPTDRDARFVQLMTDHQPDLYVYIRSLMPQPEAAADALQDTNRVLWEKRERFELDTNFIAWSFAIARNKVKQIQAKRRRHELSFDDDLIDQLADRAEESADLLDERMAAMRQCVGTLPAKDRDVIERRYSPGASAMSVADSLGRPVAWVHTAVSRVRKRLLKCINARLSGEGRS